LFGKKNKSMFAALFSGFRGEEADILEEEIEQTRIDSPSVDETNQDPFKT
jgi:hypothetical protein